MARRKIPEPISHVEIDGKRYLLSVALRPFNRQWANHWLKAHPRMRKVAVLGGFIVVDIKYRDRFTETGCASGNPVMGGSSAYLIEETSDVVA